MRAALEFIRRFRWPGMRVAWVMCAAYLGLTACSSADDKLARFIADTRQQPGEGVEPLPQMEPSESFVYRDFGLRSPFLPSSPRSGTGLDTRPEQQPNLEFLEQYCLGTLKMVGALRLGGQVYGLVETKDGLVHRFSVSAAEIEAIRARLEELLRTGAKIDATQAAARLAELEHIAAENAAAGPLTHPDIDKHPFYLPLAAPCCDSAIEVARGPSTE